MKLAALAAAGMLAVAPAGARDVALGDSIAVGLGAALGVETIARIGASSCWIAERAPPAPFDRAVISAGVNDPPGRCLARLRQRIDAARVVWILPINAAAATVSRIAAERGDSVVAYRPGADHLHPASYAALARVVRAAWRLETGAAP